MAKWYLRHYCIKWTVTNKIILRFVRTIYQVCEDTFPHILTENHILILAYEQSSNDSSCARGIRRSIPLQWFKELERQCEIGHNDFNWQ